MERTDKLRLVVALGVLALLAAACDWTQPGFDAAQTGFAGDGTTTSLSVDTVGNLQQRWSTANSSTPTELGTQGDRLVANGTVGILTPGHPLTEYRLRDGTQVWSVSAAATIPNPPPPPENCPSFGYDSKGTVAFSGQSIVGITTVSHITCFNFAIEMYDYEGLYANEIIDTAHLPSAVNPNIAVCGLGPLGADCADHQDLAVGDPVVPTDGTVIQTYDIQNMVGTADIASDHMELRGGALDYSGPTGVALGTPAVSGSTAYVAQSDGHLVAVDRATSQVLWSASIPTGSPVPTPSTDGSRVYITAGGQVMAFDAGTGAADWSSAALPGTASTQAPALAYGQVYVETTTSLTALDAASGSPAWTASLESGPDPSSPNQITAPTVANGVVYVGTRGSTLDAFAADGTTGCTGEPVVCSPLVSLPLGGAASSRPIVAGGRVAIADGASVKLFALPS